MSALPWAPGVLQVGNVNLNPSGISVVESRHMPDHVPDHRDDARRHVRHLYAEAGILDWLGEKPGPKPGEVCQQVLLIPSGPGGVAMAIVRPEMAALIRLHE